MAGIAADLPEVPSERGQLLALLEMRWRIFRRGLRRGDAKVSFVLYVLGRLLVFAFAVAAGIGSGIAACIGYNPAALAGLLGMPHRAHGPASESHLLLTLFTFVLLGWQGYSVLRGTPSSGVESELHRFPLRLRTYILLWLSSGALEAMTIIGAWVCLGIFAGLAFAGAGVLLAASVMLLYFALNLFWSRVLFLWLGRLLAKRSTREAVLIGFSLLGLLPRLLQTEKAHVTNLLHRLPILPQVFTLAHWLPPYLAVHTLLRAGDPPALVAVHAVALAAWAVVPAVALVYALRRVYGGAEVQEFAASAAPRRLAARRARIGESSGSPVRVIAAMEWDRLRHSGAAMYQVIAPLLLVMLFGVRLLATPQGVWVLPAAAAYIGLTLRCGNSFGSDGAGAQLWMLVPLPLRVVLEGKNLFAAALYAAQLAAATLLILAVSRRVAWAPVLFSACWATCYTALCFAVCNPRSLRSPKRMADTASTLRRRGAQAGGGWQLLAVMGGMALVGAALIGGSLYLHRAMLAPAVMLPLAVAAVFVYRRSLATPLFNGDITAAERLLTEVSRTAA